MKRVVISALLVLSILATFVFCSGMSAAPQGEAGIKAAVLAKSDVFRVDFVHYAKQTPSASVKKSTGYDLLGYKWKTELPVAYSMNVSNLPDGFSKAEVLTAFSVSSEVWDASTGTELFSDGNITNETSAVYGTYDGTNTVQFGLYSGSANVIAVTSIWFSRKTKSILEFDMLYNTYYAWGDADNTSGVMDIKNIATHEFGHAAGLADIYNDTFSYVTMYGYASYNETDKRDLAPPDVAGIQVLYN